MLKPDGGNLQWSNETKKRSGHSIIAESDAIPSGYSVWCPDQSRIARQGKHREQDHRDAFFFFFFCLPPMIIKSLHTDGSRNDVCHSILDPISAG